MIAVRNNGWSPFRKHLWRLRFHDHIIRNDDELNRIRVYIKDNPKNWEDENNLENMWKNNGTDSYQNIEQEADSVSIFIAFLAKLIHFSSKD